MDTSTILKEGKHSEFWKIICDALEVRIQASRNQLEQQLSIDRIKFLQYDIRICREFKNLPDILLNNARPGEEKE